MSKKKELLVSLACLLASLALGNGIFKHLNERAKAKAGRPEVELEFVSRSAPKPIFNPIAGPKPQKSRALAPMRNFTLPDEFGVEKSFQDVQEGNPALVYFFSSGCERCFNMLNNIKPTLELAGKYNFRIVGIQYLGSPEFAMKSLGVFNLPSPIFSDRQGEECSRFGVGEFTVLLVGADNNVYFRNLMDGSNWPVSSDFINTIAMESEGVQPAMPEAPAPAVENYEWRASRESVENITAMPAKPEFLPLSRLINPRIQFPEYGLMLIVLALTAAALLRRESSWLPILAASELLLVGIFYHLWLSWPANIFLFATVILLISNHKKMFGPAVAFGMFTIIGLLHPVFNEFSGARVLQLQQMAVIWRFFPQIALSLLMFRLAFTGQKQQYEKLAYAYGGAVFDPAHNGAITVKGVSKPERCDVCHQVDMFDSEAGYCSRCKANTL